MSTLRLGIDLGGTKIELVALDHDHRELMRRRVATPQGDYPGTLALIRRLVVEAERELGRQGTIGVGTPGAISPATGKMKNCNSTCLNQQPLQQDLERLLQRPIRLANDANCFALSEATDGAGAGAAVVFGVILGTGCGGGLVVHGRVLTGPNAISGEWGHNPLPWAADDERPGPACYCGKSGCIETWVSGPGLARDFAAARPHRCGTPSGVQQLTAAQVVDRAAQGDLDAEAAVQRYEDRLARGLAHVINIVDPDVIVLGGGLSQVQRLYANVPHRWGEYVFSDRVDTRLVPPRFGDASGVRGAAWLWNEA